MSIPMLPALQRGQHVFRCVADNVAMQVDEAQIEAQEWVAPSSSTVLVGALLIQAIDQ
jgi:hypothetical protein